MTLHWEKIERFTAKTEDGFTVSWGPVSKQVSVAHESTLYSFDLGFAKTKEQAEEAFEHFKPGVERWLAERYEWRLRGEYQDQKEEEG